MPDTRSNESVLSENLELDKLQIVDVGSGAGDLVRYMTTQGAHVTGLECGALQLEKASSYPLAGDEIYIEGVGQEMPFADASFDVVIFFNSLHHVPVEHMKTALDEASRVVRKGGTRPRFVMPLMTPSEAQRPGDSRKPGKSSIKPSITTRTLLPSKKM